MIHFLSHPISKNTLIIKKYIRSLVFEYVDLYTYLFVFLIELNKAINNELLNNKLNEEYIKRYISGTTSIILNFLYDDTYLLYDPIFSKLFMNNDIDINILMILKKITFL
jgi:hypothetical protein